MDQELVVIIMLAAIVLAAVVALVIRAISMRSARSISRQIQELTAEADALKAAKSDTERALAVTEVKAGRADELDRILKEVGEKLDATREAKSLGDVELAAAKEAFTRTQGFMTDLAARLASSERLAVDLRETLTAVKDGKAAAEEGLSVQREALTRTEGTVQELRKRLTEAGDNLAQAERRIAELQSGNAAAERAVAEKVAVIVRMEKAEQEQRARLDQTTVDLNEARREATGLKSRIATLEEALEQEGKQAGDKIALLTAARVEMSNQFTALAEGIMTRHGESFGKSNKDQIEALLLPLKERISEFETKVTTTHTESVKDRATLAEQIRQIAETGAMMTRETKELTEALRGSSQTQGAWGEMILDTILERSGLREGEHYVSQQSFANEDGGRVRPDVVVNLPGGQKVVVDSKVSLTAFDAMVNSSSTEERADYLQRHLGSMRTHITLLAAKDYHRVTESMLDYVVMFVPIEGALAAAIQADPGLTGFAVENNVAIATPTTLMIALRTIANVWQVEARNRNAEEIANRAGRLYDKFVGFVGDLQAVGTSIDKSRQHFDGAMSKLVSGRGNVVKQLDQLRVMGGRASRTLPTSLLEAADVVGPEPDADSDVTPMANSDAPDTEAAAN